jgi:hypothetical protein
MSNTISIAGLDKAKLLAALYNSSKPLGMGFLHFDPAPMTAEEATILLEKTTKFDYLKGRVMKVNLDTDELRTGSYNRDNGDDAVERIVANLRSGVVQAA